MTMVAADVHSHLQWLEYTLMHMLGLANSSFDLNSQKVKHKPRWAQLRQTLWIRCFDWMQVYASIQPYQSAKLTMCRQYVPYPSSHRLETSSHIQQPRHWLCPESQCLRAAEVVWQIYTFAQEESLWSTLCIMQHGELQKRRMHQNARTWEQHWSPQLGCSLKESIRSAFACSLRYLSFTRMQSFIEIQFPHKPHDNWISTTNEFLT